MKPPIPPQTPGDPLDTKPCKSCLEEIDILAKRCPHCQAWQAMLASPKGKIMVALGLLLLVSTVVPLLMMMRPLLDGRDMMDSMFPKGQPFEDHRAGLVIIEQEMFFDSLSVVAMAQLRNDTSVDWENIEIEAQFKGVHPI